MNDYEYLTQQLNLLIGFLDVSKIEVFEQIKNHDSYNIGVTVGKLYENSYENYSTHICNATILLGASHFEDFLGKCIKRILIHDPSLNKYKFDYCSFNENSNNLIDFLAESEVKRMTVLEMLKFVKKNVDEITDEMHTNMDNFRKLRNCLVHNNGLANENVGFLEFSPKQKIILSSGQVNGYGLAIRDYVSTLWKYIEGL